MIKLGFVEFPLCGSSIPQAASFARSKEMLCLSAVPTLRKGLDPSPDSDFTTQGFQWRRQGMAVAAIQGFLFGSPKKILFDESLRDRAVEIFTDSIEMSKALGGNILVVGGPTLRIKEFSSSLAYTRGLFSVFTGLAQDQGQSICLENLSDPSGNLLYSSPNEILALEEIGLGLALDIGNFASNFSYADQISPRFWARVRELVLSAKHVQLNLDLIDAEFIRSLVSNTSDLSYELFLESQSLESLSRSVDLFQEA